MEVSSTYRYAKISAFKAREVTRAIQGLPVSAALDLVAGSGEHRPQFPGAFEILLPQCLGAARLQRVHQHFLRARRRGCTALILAGSRRSENHRGCMARRRSSEVPRPRCATPPGTAGRAAMFAEIVAAFHGGNTMKRKLILAGAMLAGFVLPALADTTYYIVQDTSTKKCRIVDQKPVTREVTVVGGDGVVYHTRNEEETAMKTVKVCTIE